MMSDTAPPGPAEPFAHDFRQPLRLASDDEARLNDWLSSACAALGEACERTLPFEVQPSVASIGSTRWSRFVEELDATKIGYSLEFLDPGLHSLLVLRRPFAKLLAAGLLGERPAQLPADSTLSPATASLLKLILETFVQSVRDCWPQAVPGHIQLQRDVSALSRQRVVSDEEALVCVTFRFQLPQGTEHWYWLIPQEPLQAFLDSTASTAQVVQGADEHESLQGLLGGLPARVTVKLGSVELNPAQLKALKVGDVLILNQKVDAPLSVSVANATTFLGWPGRVGSNQALQIESVVKG